MKIGIIGVGVVGGAIKRAFAHHYIVSAYDKFKPELGTFEGVLDSDVIFVSVPSPTAKDWGQVLEPLNETCEKLAQAQYEGVVVVKCTVLPGTTHRMSKQYNLRMVHSPEFLTAAKPYEDFINQKAVLIGGDDIDVAQVVPLFMKLNCNTPIHIFPQAEMTEMMKYTHNCFLSVKVSFFNEIADVCERLGISYNTVMDGVHAIGQVGKGHTSVPGPDGNCGYGGMCFPKDTKAFYRYVDSLSLETPVFEAAVISNGRRRPEEMGV